MRWLLLLFSFAACSVETKKPSSPHCKRPLNYSTDTIPTIFSLDNKDIALWQLSPHADTLPGDITYSDFIVSECESDSIIGKWNKHTSCTIEMSGDSLLIKEIEFMAMSPNLDMVYVPFIVHTYYYYNNILQHKQHFNPEVRYTDKQISTAFQKLDTNLWRQHAEIKGTKEAYKMMRFANQMMIAAMSGDTNGYHYFRLVKEKFKPQDDYAAWYSRMDSMLYKYNAQLSPYSGL
jgi:hypothetical protein